MAVLRVAGEHRVRPRQKVLPRTAAVMGLVVALAIFAAVLSLGSLFR